MSKKNVKITIAGRTYPLTISEDEEAVVLKSQELINNNIDKLKKQYNINDSQDLLAMTTLEFAAKIQNTTSSKDDGSIQSSLKEILEHLTSAK